jgi:hypothetical protein
MMPPEYKKRKPMISGQEVTSSKPKITPQMGETESAFTGSPPDGPTSAKDVAEYSAQLLIELRDMATATGLTFLAYLIQVAYEEAAIQSGNRDEDG